jgi:hypothetical protein
MLAPQETTAQHDPADSGATIGARRLASQGLMPPAHSDPPALVRWLGAVQAQDFLGSLWALGARLPETTEADIERAIADRALLRTWPMRGTVHFVPAEDARWMTGLLAARVIARTGSIYRAAGLDEAAFARGRALVMRALADGQPMMRRDLYAMLDEAGFGSGGLRGLHLIGRLAQEGLICLGPRAGKQPTIVLLDAWAPRQRTLARDEAIAELTLRYFRSHGPATARDFAWWSGLRLAEVAGGLDATHGQLVAETIGGTTYWRGAAQAADEAAGALHLLPPFDEFLVSYKDRRAALDPADAGLWVERDHLASATIVAGARVIGAWKRTLSRGGVKADARLARPLTDTEQGAFTTAVARYGQFLGVPMLDVQTRLIA